MYKFRGEVFKDAAGQWRWRVRALNGNIVADSGEGYQNRIDCRREFDKLFRCGQTVSAARKVEV